MVKSATWTGQISTRSHRTESESCLTPPLLFPSNPSHALTCSASLESGSCICSALLPAASCASAAANSCCFPALLPGCLLLRLGRPGNRSRGCATRSSRRASSSRKSSHGPQRKSWICWCRDADCRASCPSCRRDGGERWEEEEEEERGGGGGDRDGPEAAAAAGKVSAEHEVNRTICVCRTKAEAVDVHWLRCAGEWSVARCVTKLTYSSVVCLCPPLSSAVRGCVTLWVSSSVFLVGRESWAQTLPLHSEPAPGYYNAIQLYTSSHQKKKKTHKNSAANGSRKFVFVSVQISWWFNITRNVLKLTLKKFSGA